MRQLQSAKVMMTTKVSSSKVTMGYRAARHTPDGKLALRVLQDAHYRKGMFSHIVNALQKSANLHHIRHLPYNCNDCR